MGITIRHGLDVRSGNCGSYIGLKRSWAFHVVACAMRMAMVMAMYSGLIADDDVDDLMNGVGAIPMASANPLALFSPEAKAIVAAPFREYHAAVIATSRLKQGRVFVFGSDELLIDKPASPEHGFGKLLINLVADGKNAKASVGVIDSDAIKGFLESRHIGTYSAPKDSLKKIKALIHQVRVLVADGAVFDDANIRSVLSEWVSSGGTLLTAGSFDRWQIDHADKKSPEDYPLNMFLEPAGISLHGGHAGAEKGVSEAGSFSREGGDEGEGATTKNSGDHARYSGILLNAWQALRALTAENAASLSEADREQAADSVLLAIHSTSEHEHYIRPLLKTLSDSRPAIIPSKSEPVKSTDSLRRILVAYQDGVMRHLPPEEIRAHPASDDFPGSVPAEVPRVKTSLVVDTGIPRWHSTGQYAPPGALITISIPEADVGLGLHCLIGCHTDKLWDKKSWIRWPSLTWQAPIAGSTTTIASPFGGPIYITVPEDCRKTSVTITISGGVSAPHFILGKTSLEEWKAQRDLPAPWAELECNGIILSTPSSAIRSLEDPNPVMRLWESAVEVEDDFVGWTKDMRKRPERRVFDRDIDLGNMHSGYPIMSKVKCESDTDFNELHRDGWGQWHELGHNHQSGMWTPGNQGEVTVNLFSMRVQTLLCGIRLDQCWGGGLSSAGRAKRVHNFQSNPSMNPKSWPPAVGLVFYWQLVDGFGWDVLKRVLVSYRTRPPEVKNDEDRWTEWLERYSAESHHNLTAFFRAWRIPIKASAAEHIAGESWMHPEAPK